MTLWLAAFAVAIALVGLYIAGDRWRCMRCGRRLSIAAKATDAPVCRWCAELEERPVVPATHGDFYCDMREAHYWLDVARCGTQCRACANPPPHATFHDGRPARMGLGRPLAEQELLEGIRHLSEARGPDGKLRPLEPKQSYRPQSYWPLEVPSLGCRDGGTFLTDPQQGICARCRAPAESHFHI